MLYAIRHITQYKYSQPILENVMEVRKHPLSNNNQRCLNFSLVLEPEVRTFRYQDHLGNVVHHFDVPWSHQELTILGESVVEVRNPETVVPFDWEALPAQLQQRDLFDMLQSTELVEIEAPLQNFAARLDIRADRFESPFALAEFIAQTLPETLRYDRNTTRPDTPISAVIAKGGGVCQDFAHVMLGLLRQQGVPCRYISGYRGCSTQDTSHAWVEAYVGEAGWCGFDPSKGCLVDETYVTTCIGRDYADCPPTRGVYRGAAEGKLRYAVQVRPAEQPALEDQFVAYP